MNISTKDKQLEGAEIEFIYIESIYNAGYRQAVKEFINENEESDALKYYKRQAQIAVLEEIKDGCKRWNPEDCRIMQYFSGKRKAACGLRSCWCANYSACKKLAELKEEKEKS
ncbi:hypothetical protein NO1_0255 [Candidatus Termititenax aidoneus]|uniref:Uncharacterized protein n=1 Tax=Termititenax aidoneus TaxID=2218524 RepID=A0A388TAP5_TERA1|nr:hypothetical protein NO1_0255 [Candidatus Termititenax aidoneus]